MRPGTSMVAFVIAVSMFGLAFSALLALDSFQGSTPAELRNPSVGFLFALICVLGVLAFAYPETCSKIAGLRSGRSVSTPGDSASDDRRPPVRGHHPDCEGFSSHVFTARSKTLCVGCAGLALGALISLFASVAYFFGDLRLWPNGLVPVGIGLLSVGIAFLHFSMISIPWRPLRLSINASFPVGAFLLLAGIDDLNRDLRADSILLLIILFWILARLVLARWDHAKVCGRCGIEGCSLHPDMSGRPSAP